METRLFALCLVCRKVIYYTDDINKITSLVFDDISQGHKYSFNPPHDIARVTREKNSNSGWAELIKDPPSDFEEEDNV